MKLPLNPNVELYEWGPAPMRFYYNSDWEAIMTLFPKIFPPETWPVSILISKGKDMAVIGEYPAIRTSGESIFWHYMFKRPIRMKIWDAWQRDVKNVQNWQREIEKLEELSRLSQKEFLALWKKMQSVLYQFWTNSLIPELANYGADKPIEKELRLFIKNDQELRSAMEILTTPEKMSFYQEEELALAQSSDVQAHTQKYFWIANGYGGVHTLDTNYFTRRKKELLSNLAQELKKRLAEIKNKKSKVQQKNHLSHHVIEMCDTFVNGLEWQDQRKKMIVMYIHYKELMLIEASHRLHIREDDLRNFGTAEILNMLQGEKPSAKTIADRRIGFAALMIPNQELKMTDSTTALNYWKTYLERQVDPNTTELKGIVVSSSAKAIRARVKILRDPHNADSFHKGDILVAPMTTPEYIFAMKKASAIITDTGGLMSHAAVTSRELGIPCIVGTKYATAWLKDGDLVEVDADRGVVRKL
jgi:phosphohistidine swiveling domain-containing protein